MKASLILEDGTIFNGTSIGSSEDVISEIVFNTSVVGYLENLTDPSYAGQAVCMTFPLSGNYGICNDDMESSRPWLDGYIVREVSDDPSNFRCSQTLNDFLLKYNISGISGIDTRELTRHLRTNGTMNGLITTKDVEASEVIDKIRNFKCLDPVGTVSANEIKHYEGSGFKVALYDFGVKQGIVSNLLKRNCDLTIYPSNTPAQVVIDSNPDGIMLSNGPGDPKECTDIINELKKLYETDIPIFAICLGHQLMALSCGADTKKMKFGHRGANHPVRDLATGKLYITTQNHGYVVDTDTMPSSIAVPAFENANDGTCEGFRYVNKNILTVQFHPEACAGPLDTNYLFDNFMKMMK